MDFLPIPILLILGIFLLGFTGLLLSLYGFLSRWFKYLADEKNSVSEYIKQRAYRDASKLLDDARTRSSKIVSEAQNKAQSILSETEELTDESKKRVMSILAEMQTEYDTLMHTSAKDLSDIQRKTMAKASEDIEKEVLQEAESLRKGMLKKFESELAAYKQDRIKELDNKILEIIQQVSLDVLGKTLPLNDHEDLVREALAKAKGEHVL